MDNVYFWQNFYATGYTFGAFLKDTGCEEICHTPPRGTSLIGKSVRDFFRTKEFIRIFDGFFLKTKGFLSKVYEIFWSEMPLAHPRHFANQVPPPHLAPFKFMRLPYSPLNPSLTCFRAALEKRSLITSKDSCSMSWP